MKQDGAKNDLLKTISYSKTRKARRLEFFRRVIFKLVPLVILGWSNLIPPEAERTEKKKGFFKHLVNIATATTGIRNESHDRDQHKYLSTIQCVKSLQI